MGCMFVFFMDEIVFVKLDMSVLEVIFGQNTFYPTRVLQRISIVNLLSNFESLALVLFEHQL